LTSPRESRPARKYGIPAEAAFVASHRSDGDIKDHPDYAAAKAGGNAAAVRLVEAKAAPESIEAAMAFGPDVIYAPVVAQEASGHNAIPATMAAFYATHGEARVDTRIVQAVRALPYRCRRHGTHRRASRLRWSGCQGRPLRSGR
jgi:hypothetical protein